MFWLLLGLVEEDKIRVEDPAFSLTSTFGRIFMIAHVVCTVIVALNMLIAMMNNSFDRIMVSFLCETFCPVSDSLNPIMANNNTTKCFGRGAYRETQRKGIKKEKEKNRKNLQL